ncbi:hypothetical protein NDU88_002612 [Pleurodeles waltl]|uniref:Uncharacterized protein n=1 Tax=Pleurodeles waltl TaxID=8319 RepID=A0AAV7UZ34_PLEWA|nr:hypothetical protein NDU88_002612 [Pleurodeles waltl]
MERAWVVRAIGSMSQNLVTPVALCRIKQVREGTVARPLIELPEMALCTYNVNIVRSVARQRLVSPVATVHGEELPCPCLKRLRGRRLTFAVIFLTLRFSQYFPATAYMYGDASNCQYDFGLINLCGTLSRKVPTSRSESEVRSSRTVAVFSVPPTEVLYRVHIVRWKRRSRSRGETEIKLNVRCAHRVTVEAFSVPPADFVSGCTLSRKAAFPVSLRDCIGLRNCGEGKKKKKGAIEQISCFSFGSVSYHEPVTLLKRSRINP